MEVKCARLERKMTTQLQAVDEREARWLGVVRNQIRPLRFGVVQIVVHDGEVVQIERTERVRLGRPEGGTVHLSAATHHS